MSKAFKFCFSSVQLIASVITCPASDRVFYYSSCSVQNIAKCECQGSFFLSCSFIGFLYRPNVSDFPRSSWSSGDKQLKKKHRQLFLCTGHGHCRAGPVSFMAYYPEYKSTVLHLDLEISTLPPLSIIVNPRPCTTLLVPTTLPPVPTMGRQLLATPMDLMVLPLLGQSAEILRIRPGLSAEGHPLHHLV